MIGIPNGTPAHHFGKQIRKERLARGWSLPELSARTGINAGHLSRIETGRRPPTEHVARACDAAFPERKGYFLEYYEESRTWAPPGFRDWPELENKATRLSVWSPGIIHGLLQTEDYARALLTTLPGATAEAVAGRLRSRLERQRRVLGREEVLARLFDSLRDECYRVSESLAIIRKAGDLWTGESPVTPGPTAGTA
jgi:transcriptional regulator with XRE-family HTH domain